MLSYIEALPEKLRPFLKKHGWLGGIVLIVSGIYRAVSSFFSLVVFDDMPGSVTGFAAPVILQLLMQSLVGFAIIIAGIVIIKKFRPKKTKEKENK